MTPKQESFVNHYIIDLNGTQAAIRAGYAEQYAGQQAFQLLADPDIKAAVQKKREEIGRETGIDVDFITRRAKLIADRCMQAEPVMIFDGENWVESGEYKFDSSGANKAVDTLAKIIGAYEKDNDQQRPINNINFQPIINSSGIPLATREQDVRDE